MKKAVIFKNKTIKKILEKYEIVWALNHVTALGGWDLQTYMPQKGAKERGKALAILTSLRQKYFLSKEFFSLIDKADKEKLNRYEKALLKNLKRSLKIYRKIPTELLKKEEELSNEAQIVWQKAKQTDNFKLFEPYLSKLVSLTRKKAEHLGYKEHPYDALLDLFEEGWTTNEVNSFFEEIIPSLSKILYRIQKSENYSPSHPLFNLEYSQKELAKVNQKILELFQVDRERIRLDTSAHPFTQYIAYNDTRITTRYKRKDFAPTILSTVHELGHALHHMQCDKKFMFTPLCDLDSLGMGESQSRFLENFVGRSLEFITYIYEDLLKINLKMSKYSPTEIYKYLNLVKPSLIRTEGDEITYHFHIKLRFDIEKGLIENSIKVKDIPEIWRAKMKEYLGVVPKKESEASLQDVHWSLGAFGYFPTYSLGTFLSGIWKNALEKELGRIDNLINPEKITFVTKWLRENIHQYGSLYSTKEMVRRISGRNFTPTPLLNYLENKYKKIYSL